MILPIIEDYLDDLYEYEDAVEEVKRSVMSEIDRPLALSVLKKIQSLKSDAQYA